MIRTEANTISSKYWTYSGKTFVTEISDLPRSFMIGVLFTPEKGFFMQSEKTGNIQYFSFSKRVRSDEGEVQFEEFINTELGITAQIFND